jgi:hypothetical protein
MSRPFLLESSNCKDKRHTITGTGKDSVLEMNNNNNNNNNEETKRKKDEKFKRARRIIIRKRRGGRRGIRNIRERRR